MAKRKPELRREDCITHEQKLAYSRQMYERWLAIGENEPPSVLLDFKRFPPETEDWHHPEYFIAWANAERQKRKDISEFEAQRL